MPTFAASPATLVGVATGADAAALVATVFADGDSLLAGAALSRAVTGAVLSRAASVGGFASNGGSNEPVSMSGSSILGAATDGDVAAAVDELGGAALAEVSTRAVDSVGNGSKGSSGAGDAPDASDAAGASGAAGASDAAGAVDPAAGTGSPAPNTSNAAINSAESVAKSSSGSPEAVVPLFTSAAAEELAERPAAGNAAALAAGSIAAPRSSGAICASGPSSGSNGNGSKPAAGLAIGGTEDAGISGPDSLSGSKGSRGKREAASIIRTLA